MADIDYVPLRTDQSLDVAAVELPGFSIGPSPLEFASLDAAHRGVSV